VDWYRGFGFAEVPGAKPLQLDSETYVPMERVILYHQLRVAE
jgi:hypothetical protein